MVLTMNVADSQVRDRNYKTFLSLGFEVYLSPKINEECYRQLNFKGLSNGCQESNFTHTVHTKRDNQTIAGILVKR